MAYTTAAQVATAMGRTFTQAQSAYATALADVATEFADRETNRSWQTPPILNEIYTIDTTTTLYLRSRPVASVQQVTVRSRAIGDAGLVLQAGVEYELQDPNLGRLELAPGGMHDSGLLGLSAPYTDPLAWGAGSLAGGMGLLPGSVALVSYTPNVPLSKEIGHAATLLVAHWMLSQFDPDRAGLAGYKLADEIQVTVDEVRRTGDIPAEIIRILNGRKLPIWA